MSGPKAYPRTYKEVVRVTTSVETPYNLETGVVAAENTDEAKETMKLS